ncbi:2833_t:CDS:2, partial [Paraglomus brasilianum]
KFLDVYYNDVEAWLELASLYLSQHLYQQAAFCLEELILLQPQNHFYHLKYAEVLYTSDNIPLALKEYCRVIELCDDYVRALYGIKLCTHKLRNPSSPASSSKITGNTDSHTLSVLNELATERLLHVYSHKKCAKDIKDIIREWLQDS